MVVVDGQSGGRGICAELAPGTAVAVCVDQPGQQSVPPGPAHRWLHIPPPLRQLGRLTGKRDPVSVDEHSPVGDDRLPRDEATGQQGGSVSAHVRIIHRARCRRQSGSTSAGYALTTDAVNMPTSAIAAACRADSEGLLT